MDFLSFVNNLHDPNMQQHVPVANHPYLWHLFSRRVPTETRPLRYTHLQQLYGAEKCVTVLFLFGQNNEKILISINGGQI